MLILQNVGLAKNFIQVFCKLLDFSVNFLSASATVEVCHLECAILAFHMVCPVRNQVL